MDAEVHVKLVPRIVTVSEVTRTRGATEVMVGVVCPKQDMANKKSSSMGSLNPKPMTMPRVRKRFLSILSNRLRIIGVSFPVLNTFTVHGHDTRGRS